MLASDTTFTVTPANSTLSVTGALTATGRAVTKAGLGVAQFEFVRAASLNVNQGTVRISTKSSALSTSGTSMVNSLSVASNANLDLTNNGLIVDYTGASPLTTIAGQISAGYQGGTWTGNEITSSTAALVAADGSNLHKTALGYGEANALGIGSFGGQGVDTTSVVVGYTLAGDANLDGTVNSLDFTMLADAFGATGGAVWTQGDFNYDGIVNALDFDAIATNFGQALPPPGLGAQVPESSAALLAGLSLLLLSCCGRKRTAERSVANSNL